MKGSKRPYLNGDREENGSETPIWFSLFIKNKDAEARRFNLTTSNPDTKIWQSEIYSTAFYEHPLKAVTAALGVLRPKTLLKSSFIYGHTGTPIVDLKILEIIWQAGEDG